MQARLWLISCDTEDNENTYKTPNRITGIIGADNIDDDDSITHFSGIFKNNAPVKILVDNKKYKGKIVDIWESTYMKKLNLPEYQYYLAIEVQQSENMAGYTNVIIEEA